MTTDKRPSDAPTEPDPWAWVCPDCGETLDQSDKCSHPEKCPGQRPNDASADTEALLADARSGCAKLIAEKVRLLAALGLLTEEHGEEHWSEEAVLAEVRKLRARCSDKAKATPLCNGCGHPRSDHADPEKHPCGEHQTCCHNCACVEYVDTDTEAVAFERGFAAGEEHAKALDCANTREKNLAQALGSLGYGDRIEEWAKEPPSWAGGNRPEVKP